MQGRQRNFIKHETLRNYLYGSHYTQRKKLPLTVIESHILTKPLETIKDKLLDAFSTMKDKPVSVELKIKYI